MATHHFLIEPLKSVGPIRFGMHRDEVGRAFTYVYSSFFKTPESKVRADQCIFVGLIIHYDDEARVNYIEIFKPQYGTVTLELFGRDITDISVKEAFRLLSSHSSEYTRNEYGYDFPKPGINIFNSHLESEEEAVECFGLSSL